MLWTVVLERTLESPLDYKKIKPLNSKGNQSWIFIGRTDAEAESPVLWPPDAKNLPFWKDPDAEKDWWRVEKGTAEDEIVAWHHGLDVLQYMGLQRVRHNWETELNWTELNKWMLQSTFYSHIFSFHALLKFAEIKDFSDSTTSRWRIYVRYFLVLRTLGHFPRLDSSFVANIFFALVSQSPFLQTPSCNS